MRFRSAIIKSVTEGDNRFPEEILVAQGKYIYQDAVGPEFHKEQFEKRYTQPFKLDANTGAYEFTDDATIWICDTAREGGLWRS